MPSRLKWIIGFLIAVSSLQAFAADSLIRWTVKDDPDASFAHVLAVLKQKTGNDYTADNFLLEDDRDLAFNHYRRYVQLRDGVPIHDKSIRIWTELGSNKTVQVEAAVDAPVQPSFLGSLFPSESASQLRESLTPEKTAEIVRPIVLSDSQDPYFQGINWKDEWKNGELRRLVKIRGKRGYHHIEISLRSHEVVSQQYREFPHSDEFSLNALVYPVYEESDLHHFTKRVPAKLNHLLSEVPVAGDDIYASLRSERYYDATFDPTLGESASGRAQGYWSMSYVKDQAARIRENLRLAPNDFSRGVLLQGEYATVSIYPDALTKFGPWSFTPVHSAPLFPNWVDAVYNGQPAQEMIPSQAYQNKPITSQQELLSRPARRLPDNDPKTYLNDGFDEIQVYYAIDTLFTTLRARGWTDPDLSTRPINAFLYDPDISERDNAFYTDDTINFTTYSPTGTNAARNNTTIWHELGHGVMDRLMGDNIELADTGGLSEGMADFVAAMVLQAVTKGVPFPDSNEFRIINNTGFNLTNEVHDDGEAYGGTMRDFMLGVIKSHGQKGLDQVVDLVLEAMRLTRDYPGLTANDWFNHILFADSLGRPGLRLPGELKPFLLNALAKRNYKADGGQVATFTLTNAADQKEIVADGPGSRSEPILATLPKDGQQSYEITASVKSSDTYKFVFPVRLHVQFNGGPLQGAVHWVGEEKGAQDFVLKDENDVAHVPLTVTGTCDSVDLPDGSCSDFVYFQIFNADQTAPDAKPVAKKRFYVHVANPTN